MWCRRPWQRVAACAFLAMACSAGPAAAEKQDHVHLTMNLVVSPRQPLTAGDVLGLYAVELLACPEPQSRANDRTRWLAWLDRVSDHLMSSAQASHRDRFDRPGARIVHTRVPLDRAGTYPLGRLVIPSGRYCRVRLTLTRLPATTDAHALPALETSVRLSRPGSLAPVATTYPVALELPLAQPWQAGHGNARMSLTLDPSSVAPVLANASLSEGALLRQVVARWVASSEVALHQPR
jgi:hypothetical protein